MLWIVTYDIADDRRRESVSNLLCAWGARVQFSVFECEFGDEATAQQVFEELAELIDEVDDQVRVYRLIGHDPGPTRVLGRRRLEEREDFWII